MNFLGVLVIASSLLVFSNDVFASGQIRIEKTNTVCLPSGGGNPEQVLQAIARDIRASCYGGREQHALYLGSLIVDNASFDDFKKYCQAGEAAFTYKAEASCY